MQTVAAPQPRGMRHVRPAREPARPASRPAGRHAPDGGGEDGHGALEHVDGVGVCRAQKLGTDGTVRSSIVGTHFTFAFHLSAGVQIVAILSGIHRSNTGHLSVNCWHPSLEAEEVV